MCTGKLQHVADCKPVAVCSPFHTYTFFHLVFPFAPNFISVFFCVPYSCSVFTCFMFNVLVLGSYLLIFFYIKTVIPLHLFEKRNGTYLTSTFLGHMTASFICPTQLRRFNSTKYEVHCMKTVKRYALHFGDNGSGCTHKHTHTHTH